VTLTAQADPGALFAGWSGCDSVSGIFCTVTLTANMTVTATFSPVPSGSVTLTVTPAGSGTGTVISGSGGISCGGICAAAFTSGTPVTLTAGADPGTLFAGWSGGGCSGTGPCTVTLVVNTSVRATFSRIFSDAPLLEGTLVKAVHLTQLRQAVDTLRSRTGLGPGAYTDATLSPGVTPIRAVHLTQLRAALNDVRPTTYTDLVAGQTVIRKAHIEELRTAIRAAE